MRGGERNERERERECTESDAKKVKKETKTDRKRRIEGCQKKRRKTANTGRCHICTKMPLQFYTQFRHAHHSSYTSADTPLL